VRRYYPVFLDLRGRPVVVIGGGQVALGKVQGLLDAEAQVTVVSPELHPTLAQLAQEGKIRHLARPYMPGDLRGYALAFVATDDRSINAQVAQEGRKLGVWVNAVDDPANCDFIMPAVVRKGGITVAISTGGGSPAMARKLREELERFLSDELASMLELAAQVRQHLREKGIFVDAETWNRALDRELLELLKRGLREEARTRLLTTLLGQKGKD
jgi:precorrin-2 dehydrogenase/sirohydrochlorin ferrochelatase